jgi:hypothetical protein
MGCAAKCVRHHIAEPQKTLEAVKQRAATSELWEFYGEIPHTQSADKLNIEGRGWLQSKKFLVVEVFSVST